MPFRPRPGIRRIRQLLGRNGEIQMRMVPAAFIELGRAGRAVSARAIAQNTQLCPADSAQNGPLLPLVLGPYRRRMVRAFLVARKAGVVASTAVKLYSDDVLARPEVDTARLRIDGVPVNLHENPSGRSTARPASRPKTTSKPVGNEAKNVGGSPNPRSSRGLTYLNGYGHRWISHRSSENADNRPSVRCRAPRLQDGILNGRGAVRECRGGAPSHAPYLRRVNPGVS